MACSPGGRFLKFSFILIPFAPDLPTGLRTAVPMFSPDAFATDTLAESAAWRLRAPAAAARSITDVRFIIHPAYTLGPLPVIKGMANSVRVKGYWHEFSLFIQKMF